MFSDFLPTFGTLMIYVEKCCIDSDRLQKKTQYDTCAVHAGYLRLQTQTQTV